MNAAVFLWRENKPLPWFQADSSWELQYPPPWPSRQNTRMFVSRCVVTGKTVDGPLRPACLVTWSAEAAEASRVHSCRAAHSAHNKVSHFSSIYYIALVNTCNCVIFFTVTFCPVFPPHGHIRETHSNDTGCSFSINPTDGAIDMQKKISQIVWRFPLQLSLSA